MPQRVAVSGFVDARFQHSLVDGALNHLFVEVMALDAPRTRIGGMRGGREDILPAPVPVFVRVFHFEGVGQILSKPPARAPDGTQKEKPQP